MPQKQTQVIVIGAGAIGMLVAGRLAGAARHVALLARPSAVSAFAAHGLRIRQDGVQQEVNALQVIGDPARFSAPEPPDLAILCVKGYDTLGAIPALEALRPRAILTLQNGIGHEETLARRFGAERVLAGAITSSVEVEAPASVVVTKAGGIGLAPVAGQPQLDRYVALFRDAGFPTRQYASYRSLKWSKALLNMLGNATVAILDLPIEAIYAEKRLAALEQRALREALGVMDRLGAWPVNLPRYPAALLALALRWMPPALLGPLLRRKVAGGRGGKRPSLYLDLARGAPRTEAEFLYGAVARIGAELGVPTPVNRALWETLRAIVGGEMPWDAFRGQPERLLDAVRDMR